MKTYELSTKKSASENPVCRLEKEENPMRFERYKSFMINNFTLVELLITIAIIAILASLLLPALQKAQKKGRWIKCRSNLKNIGTFQSYYVSDNKDYLVPIRMDSNLHQGMEGLYPWYEILYLTYFSRASGAYDKTILTCPEDPGKSDSTYIHFRVKLSYGYNCGINSDVETSTTNHMALPVTVLRKIGSVKYADKIVVTGDTFAYYLPPVNAPKATQGIYSIWGLFGAVRANVGIYRAHDSSGMNVNHLDGHVSGITRFPHYDWGSALWDAPTANSIYYHMNL